MIAVAVTAAALASGGWYLSARGSESEGWRTAPATRADVRSAVSSTGTLQAVTTVQVGTQVSGQIAHLAVDFNDRVRRGQLLARLDPTLQRAAVAEAQAGLDRAVAQATQAAETHARNQQLHERQIITASEMESSAAGHAVAAANVRSARIALDRARQNLAYTSIHSPIDGVVVERNVDVGQTVAASLSAPQLFLLAQDLSAMQIVASVDESDIGLIEPGQPVTFVVPSYTDATFEGRVRQVRLQSATMENVVSYKVVIEVGNPDGRLLPGMTATVQFLTGEARDALTVPLAALRFRPPSDAGRRAPVSTDSGTVWTVGPAGDLRPHRVRTGLSDGQRTVVEGGGIVEGTEVVVGTAIAGEERAAGRNPLIPAGRPRGGR